MAQTAIYKLIPRSAFHFGERGVGVEETADLLHSDTLFSAIASAWRAGDEEPDPAAGNNLPSVQPFASGEPPFRISSAFPYAGDVLLFPRPQIPLGVAKGLKRVELVSEGALGLLGQGTVPDEDRAHRELLQGGRIWVTPEERDDIVALMLEHAPDAKTRERLRVRFEQDTRHIKLWSGSGEAPVPHVAVDRINSLSNLFFSGRLQFAPGCGLYFWVEFLDTNYESRLEDALTFLQDEGLGGRRTTGHGQFTFERKDRPLPEIGAANRLMILSLYHPTEAEVKAGVLREAWYKRIPRRGWIYSPDGKNLRRKGLWMLREGAVLSCDWKEKVLGDLTDLKPGEESLRQAGLPPFVHPVWRYGYALTLPLRLEGLT